MKKLLGIVVLSLMLSTNVYAKIIYCYEANQGNEMLKSRIPSDFTSSETIEYFEIDDNKKRFRSIPIKKTPININKNLKESDIYLFKLGKSQCLNIKDDIYKKYFI